MKISVKICFALALSLTLGIIGITGGVAHAAAKVYDFNDPKGTNGIGLGIDAMLEPVVGYADGISGTCNFDPSAPEKTTGNIIVAVSSVKFTHPGYTNSVQGYGLGRDKFPTITCALKKILSGKIVKQGIYEGRVAVDFTIKGITKPLVIPLRVNYHPGRAYERDSKTDGDLLIVRSDFKVSRKAFNVAQEVPADMCGDDVDIHVAIVGTSGKLRYPPKEIIKQKEETKKEIKPLVLQAGEKTATVAERMAFHHVPGMSVVTVKNFALDSIRHYGDTGNGKLPTDDTLYAAGTMGHPLVAALALRSEEMGIISLDKDINNYLKSWKSPQDGVTTRQLLLNRSGFTYHKYGGYDPRGRIPTITQVLKGEKPAQTPATTLTTPPGTEFNLAAENYVVFQQVAEDVTGVGFNALMQNQIFSRLGMTKSQFVATRPSEASIGYDDEGKALPMGARIYPELAASGLWTTPKEYATFVVDMMKTANGQGGKLMSTQNAKAFFAQPDNTKEQGMGFGKGGDLYFRGGNAAGFYCLTYLKLEKGEAVIIFVNRNLCWEFANEVCDAILKELAS